MPPPDHLPSLALSVIPSWAFPEVVGGEVLTGFSSGFSAIAASAATSRMTLAAPSASQAHNRLGDGPEGPSPAGSLLFRGCLTPMTPSSLYVSRLPSTGRDRLCRGEPPPSTANL